MGVSAKAVSRWEKGDSTPDMEKLIAISDMFEISLDELVMDKVPTQIGEASSKSEIAIELKEKVLTDENKKKAKKWTLSTTLCKRIMKHNHISQPSPHRISSFPRIRLQFG